MPSRSIGENRKMLVFPLAELPELARGQGVTLQRYRDGGLSDAIAFRLADGLSWALGGESGRVRTETRPDAMAGGARRGGPDAADRLPADESVRLTVSIKLRINALIALGQKRELTSRALKPAACRLQQTVCRAPSGARPADKMRAHRRILRRRTTQPCSTRLPIAAAIVELSNGKLRVER